MFTSINSFSQKGDNNYQKNWPGTGDKNGTDDSFSLYHAEITKQKTFYLAKFEHNFTEIKCSE